MTAPATTRRAGPFNGNDSATSFPFTFKVFSAADVQVQLTDTSLITTTLARDSDYTVSVNPDQDASPGGTISYPISGAPLATGEKLVALGATEYEQPADLPEGGAYRAKVVEDALDRTEFQIQQLVELSERSLVLPATSAANVTLPTPTPLGRLGWNGTGNALVNYSPDSVAGFPRPEDYFVAGDPDDTASFVRGFAASYTLFGTPGRIYNINAVDLDSRRFVGNGCVIRKSTGARYAFRLRGYKPGCTGFTLQDSDAGWLTTTLSSSILLGATALPVASVAGAVQNMPVFQDIDAAVSWTFTEITSIVSSTINTRDASFAAASGKSVVTGCGAIWVEDALWWVLDDITIVNARGGVLIKPSASGLSNRGSFTRVGIDGLKYFGVLKMGNAAGVKAFDVKIWGGYVETPSATGNGTAGPFTFSPAANCYLKRDLTVYVNGVLQTYNIDWVFTTAKTISFLAGHFPANGAAITFQFFRNGIRGLVEDQRNTAIISGGNSWIEVETLGSFVGAEVREAELTDFTNLICDTCAYVGLAVDNSTYNVSFNKVFLGYNRSNLKVSSSSTVTIGRMQTTRVPAADTVDGVLDNNIEVDAGSTPEIDAGQWFGGDYQVGGAGRIQWKGGKVMEFFSTLGSAIPSNTTRYITLWGHTAGATPPSRAQFNNGNAHAIELYVQVDIAPGAGQTFTYQLNVNGVDVGPTTTITGAGVFETTLPMSYYVQRGHRVCLKVITSVTAAAAEHNATLQFR